jgi:CBS domain containing-hemolysin-like protein
LVLGEQAPKIAAIRRPETILLWCAAPLKAFYFLFYPLLVGLSSATSILLRTVGIKSQTEHDIPLGEGEIRALVHQSHIHGMLSRSEHRLISAVFDFDEMICRRVMVPRGDVVFLNTDSSLEDAIELTRKMKHSRYPVCEGSMDKVVGVVHVKDMVGMPVDGSFDLASIMRPPQFVPETIPARRLLRQIQATHQHMAFAVDEYGSVTGIVTLENILEPIIGSVEDEFDNEQPDILMEGPQQFMVAGSTSVEVINRKLGLTLDPSGVDTISGLLMAMTGKMPAKGDRITLPGAVVEVTEVRGRRTVHVRMTLENPPPETAR